MALLASIVTRNVGGVTGDKLLSISGGMWARRMAIGVTWQTVRIAMRWRMTRTTGLSGPPYFYLGLTSGTDRLPGSASPRHFVGIRSNATAWTMQGSDYIRYALSRTVISPGAETAATIGTQSGTGAPHVASGNGNRLLYLSVDITRGDPFTVAAAWSSTNYTDITPDVYANVFAITPATAASFINGAAATMAVDEPSNGYLDSVCTGFMGSEDAMEISEIGYARIA